MTAKKKAPVEIPPKLIVDLMRFEGIPPFTGGMCEGDGYYMNSIRREFGGILVSQALRRVIDPMQRDHKAMTKRFVEKWKRKYGVKR